ncbi:MULTISPECIES: rhamnulokinase [Clavibacter]|uniref:rhamnulokinase n=1 Tax=Clavibacter TaxID=1573 RepID=UPI000E65FE85|nr:MULTISPECIES: rhamnulokinase family protein [Clavibacter]MBP2456837.1 rhamnulokinase [Clavibacter michiganensis]MDQ0409407.1 rhamnulokinase [Clavibacter michiganensis]RIJ58021.1 rhamnulokinase [Clavibacter phaseoli]UKF31952.1 rhamnulokinase [Clavibacter phaseoli]UKF37874.1 rhamnulokinase [Clavibacter phaseoli]
MVKQVAAVDLGASSGRVILGSVDVGGIRLRHIARFANRPVPLHESAPDASGLHWDTTGLWRSVLDGLGAAVRDADELVSIGVDSWAVDYALLRGGRMLGTPYHYRDARTAAGVAAAHRRISAEDLFARTGLQHLPFNTVFQLTADRLSGTLPLADRALLMPDLLAWWLTGVQATEVTNASTTGLVSPITGTLDLTLLDLLSIPRDMFAPFIEPGATLGSLLPSIRGAIGAGDAVSVTAVGSHDTASAVVAVPMIGDSAAYISSGTWSLVGLELHRPLLTEDARLAGFTNEGGVDGTTRLLRNVSGLWLLSESMRAWDGAGSTDSERSSDLATLLDEAASVPGLVPTFDIQDPRFTPPGNMPTRIAAWFEEHDVPVPATRAALVRSILESLAETYAATLRDAERISGRTVREVHVVGGGSQNALLCQLTADRTGLPVLAGPVEATAIGNILVQARSQGLASGSLESLRSLVLQSYPPVRYRPRTRAR